MGLGGEDPLSESCLWHVRNPYGRPRVCGLPQTPSLRSVMRFAAGPGCEPVSLALSRTARPGLEGRLVVGAELLPWVFRSGWASGINAYAVALVMGLLGS